jgi:hypothetical protein
MPRIKIIRTRTGGWSDWVVPVMQGYRMGCCDCGLVHNIDFSVVRIVGEDEKGNRLVEEVDETYRVLFRAQRNNRSTAQVRRKRQ